MTKTIKINEDKFVFAVWLGLASLLVFWLFIMIWNVATLGVITTYDERLKQTVNKYCYFGLFEQKTMCSAYVIFGFFDLFLPITFSALYFGGTFYVGNKKHSWIKIEWYSSSPKQNSAVIK